MRFRKNSRQGGIERDLRDTRPRLPGDLADSLTAAAGTPRRGSSRRTGAARLAVLGIAVAAVAAVGGIGFAASTAFQSAKVSVQKVSAGAAKSISVKQRVAVRNAAADQYAKAFQVKPEPGKDQVQAATAKPTVNASNPGVIFIETDCTLKYSGPLYLYVVASPGTNRAKLDPSRTTVDGDPAKQAAKEQVRYDIYKPRTVHVVFAVYVANTLNARRSVGETLTPVCLLNKDIAEAPAVKLTTVPARAKTATPESITGTKSVGAPSKTNGSKVFTAFTLGKGRIVVTPAKGVTIVWNLKTSTGPTPITVDKQGYTGPKTNQPTWDADLTYSYPASLKTVPDPLFTVTFSAMP